MSRPYALPLLLGLCLTGIAADLKPNDPAAVPLDEPATLTAPKGPKGWYWHGLVQKNDSSWDLRDVYAVRFEVRNTGTTPFEGSATLHAAEFEGRRDRFDRTTAAFRLPVSAEWQSVELPISSFDFARGESYTLKFIARISFAAKSGKAEVHHQEYDRPETGVPPDAAEARLGGDVRETLARHGRTLPRRKRLRETDRHGSGPAARGGERKYAGRSLAGHARRRARNA